MCKKMYKSITWHLMAWSRHRPCTTWLWHPDCQLCTSASVASSTCHVCSFRASWRSRIPDLGLWSKKRNLHFCRLSTKFSTLTFNFQVGLARQVVALSDNAGVPAAIARLWILDDQGEDVVVVDKWKLCSFVALLNRTPDFVNWKCFLGSPQSMQWYLCFTWILSGFLTISINPLIIIINQWNKKQPKQMIFLPRIVIRTQDLTLCFRTNWKKSHPMTRWPKVSSKNVNIPCNEGGGFFFHWL